MAWQPASSTQQLVVGLKDVCRENKKDAGDVSEESLPPGSRGGAGALSNGGWSNRDSSSDDEEMKDNQDDRDKNENMGSKSPGKKIQWKVKMGRSIPQRP